MTIDEALKYSQQLNPLFKTYLHADFEKAHNLGIEALKRIKEGRRKGYDFFGHQLPGETEEAQ